MSTPTAPFTPEALRDFAPEPGATPVLIDPDNPPWGVFGAGGVWVASIGVMVALQVLAVIPYIFYRHRFDDPAQIGTVFATDPNVLLISIIAVIPAHALTLGMVWALVTRFGQRPFWETLGWGWGKNVGFWTSAAIAVGLLLLGGLLAQYIGGEKTPFDEMLQSSVPARFATAFLATATAPLVEEMIYRGLLYPAVRRLAARLVARLKATAAWGREESFAYTLVADPRRTGMWMAVVFVGTLFTLVHVAQYYNNLGVITAVATLGFALTYVRARTGRLLPCFIIHLVFNGIQCAGLVIDYFYPFTRDEQTPAQTGLALAQLAHLFGLVF